MKILLGESAPQKLRLLIDTRHSVATTAYQGNSPALNCSSPPIRNSVTSRTSNNRRIAILVLSTNNWDVVKSGMPTIAAAIERASPCSFLFVDIGHARG